MLPSVLATVSGGATILTPSRRLARRLRREWNLHKRRAGFTIWPAADILPWTAWVERRWRDALYSGVVTQPLLSPLQERLLWERIIQASPHGLEILRADSAAAVASEAWSLIHQWRLPIDDPAFETTGDASAFRAWAREYSLAGFVDHARLPDVIERGSDGALVGFDELTPQQKTLCGDWKILPSVAEKASRAVRTAHSNAEAEIEAAAQWSRGILEADPNARVGIVIPRLDSARTAVQRIFEATLDPAGTTTPAFHIALGPPLAQWPSVHAALLLLETVPGEVPLRTLTAILLSPWIAGASEERGARAMFDARLRRDGGHECSLASVASHKHCPPRFRQLLDAGRRAAVASQSPSGWSRDFSTLLAAFGWPGDASLASVEFQAVEAFRGALSQLATLDIVLPPAPAGAALSLLRRISSETPFQPEDLDQPVQILGMLDASNEAFDHLRVLSLDDETWPPAPSPNPFVPLSLQRARNVPHCSPESQLDFARRLTRRLLGAAPDVVVSHALADGERDLQPSPLVAHIPVEPHVDNARAWYLQPAALEAVLDVQAPPIPPDTAHTGGTRTLQFQAACPFRAFAELRLGARPLESPPLGFDPRDRGILLHEALRNCWSELSSQRNLAAATPDQLTALIGRSVSRAIRDSRRRPRSAFQERLEAIEQKRLTALLETWLEIEKQRPVPFTAMPPEQPRDISIGGLRLQARIDRIDRLDDGRLVIIDYKSTAPAVSAWEGDRPDEPQLPMYAVSSDAPLAAVAFAQVQTGDSFFRGFGADPAPFDGLKAADVETLLDGWRTALNRLGEQFRDGHAPVDPKDRDTCAYCHLHSLCRIHETE